MKYSVEIDAGEWCMTLNPEAKSRADAIRKAITEAFSKSNTLLEKCPEPEELRIFVYETKPQQTALSLT